MFETIAIVGAITLAALGWTDRRQARGSQMWLACAIALLVILAFGGSLIECRRQGGCIRPATAQAADG